MSLFGRLSGKEHFQLPAGARAFADDLFAGHTYVVRYGTPEQISAGTCERVPGSPTFETNGGAEMYAAFVNGEGPLNWDINGVGKAV